MKEWEEKIGGKNESEGREKRVKANEAIHHNRSSVHVARESLTSRIVCLSLSLSPLFLVSVRAVLASRTSLLSPFSRRPVGKVCVILERYGCCD